MATTDSGQRPTIPLWLLRPMVAMTRLMMAGTHAHAVAMTREAMLAGNASQKQMAAMLEDTLQIKQQLAAPPVITPVTVTEGA